MDNCLEVRTVPKMPRLPPTAKWGQFIFCKETTLSKITLKKWDVIEHLNTEEDMVLYLEACLDQADPALIAAALGDIARARGMSQVARDAGLSRESLYRALSGKGNPEFSTVIKVIKALGIKLHAKPAPTAG